MKFLILHGDKKTVRARLEQITGDKAKYTMAPRFAHVLRGIFLERDGSVTAEEGADLNLCRMLEAEGILQAQDPYPDETEGELDVEEETVRTAGQELEEESDDHIPDSEYEQEAEEESAASLGIREADERSTNPNTNQLDRVEHCALSVAFPLERHRPESLCNLVYTIFSKGKLLSKATGGRFSASKELVDILKTGSFVSNKDVIEIVGNMGEDALQGLRFEENKVIFDGFAETESGEDIRAWTELCAAINLTAIKQHNIYAKQVDEANEKFAFRTWLTRLGMNGTEMKSARRILYRNLSGHTAFRTAKDEEKWKTKQAAKRAELKALKAAANAESEEGAAED